MNSYDFSGLVECALVASHCSEQKADGKHITKRLQNPEMHIKVCEVFKFASFWHSHSLLNSNDCPAENINDSLDED